MQSPPGNLTQWGIAGLAIGAVMVLAQVVLELVRHRRNGKGGELSRLLDARELADAMQKMAMSLAVLQTQIVELRAQLKELVDDVRHHLERK